MIDIYISTANDSIFKLTSFLFSEEPEFNFCVVHQVFSKKEVEQYEKIYAFLHELGIEVIVSYAKGLSKSRNQAIDRASADFIYLTDDDIEINYVNLKQAQQKLSENKLDFVTCEVITDQGEKFKNYDKRKSFELYNIVNSASISSVELLFNRIKLQSFGVKYDESFGLGARYPSCEEYIFITDCIKAGAKGYHLELDLCVHPACSSGQDFSTKLSIETRGAMIRRIFGWFSFPLALLLLLKINMKLSINLKSHIQFKSIYKGFYK